MTRTRVMTQGALEILVPEGFLEAPVEEVGQIVRLQSAVHVGDQAFRRHRGAIVPFLIDNDRIELAVAGVMSIAQQGVAQLDVGGEARGALECRKRARTAQRAQSLDMEVFGPKPVLIAPLDEFEQCLDRRRLGPGRAVAALEIEVGEHGRGEQRHTVDGQCPGLPEGFQGHGEPFARAPGRGRHECQPGQQDQ
jgi:hypothetical protein